MTNDNFKPIAQLPKTETKIVLNDWSQGAKKSPLSVAARSKVINRSGGNYLSEKEGYGPCDVCKKKEVTVEFKMACPAAGCSDSREDYWHHNKSGCEDSCMLISNKGILTCGGCATSYNMSNWSFNCSEHEGGYKSMNKKSWNKTMGYALFLANVNSAIQDLSVYVANHPKEFGFES